MNFKLSVYGLNIYFSGKFIINSTGLQDISTSPLVPFLPLVSRLERTFAKLNSVWMTAVANRVTFCSLLAIWWSSIHPQRYWPWLTDSEIYMGLLWHRRYYYHHQSSSLFPYFTGYLKKYLPWPTRIQGSEGVLIISEISKSRQITYDRLLNSRPLHLIVGDSDSVDIRWPQESTLFLSDWEGEESNDQKMVA